MRFAHLAVILVFWSPASVVAAEPALRTEALLAMRKATEYYTTKVAAHGGYVYHYTLDLKKRWGEGAATADQVWVQPPGTPTVGMAYLAAYKATGDTFYLEAAHEAAKALMYGQLKSGGWTNSVDFDPNGKLRAQYRNGPAKGRNTSTLDDGITQSALQFMMQADQAFKFQNKEIHEATLFALDALFKAQFANGAFPQVWTGPVPEQPVLKASYPTYEWRTENRIKAYWDLYTLNDNSPGFVADTLLEVMEIYEDPRARQALEKLGDFLILAQMPEPQPAWAQQYDFQMRPVWARKFEPPAISGRESIDAIETLMKVYRVTQDKKYLEPIPRALAWLKKSQLQDGRLARYYELKTNTPLYMNEKYELTYDDSNAPDHYGWKTNHNLPQVEKQFAEVSASKPAKADNAKSMVAAKRVKEVIDALDKEGRWVSHHNGERLVGQPKFPPNEDYLSSEMFSRNLELLSEYVQSQGN